ncbi:unnamed protein product (macronuclear) [Paramecium tetraurelia]|uniref:Uncharacterized protein n=1 Tax=Paramecium tetraurelia TaxID=5888 RepID=A0DYA8_PARTE|nr:uncharacterized protein GSPATT00002993001 [Paramecium tetraurelia]CAK88025.1 unnamed protein product [Paramecium tetraurelia]|eukprot:XP_001455422.1 hypothetical protein (macronuclear) [Paramecium tetraurelia strain d4-2]
MNINEKIERLQKEISDLKLKKKYQELPEDANSLFYNTQKYLFFKKQQIKPITQKPSNKGFSLSKAVFG